MLSQIKAMKDAGTDYAAAKTAYETVVNGPVSVKSRKARKALIVTIPVSRYRKLGFSGAGTWMDDTTQKTRRPFTFWLLRFPSLLYTVSQSVFYTLHRGRKFLSTHSRSCLVWPLSVLF